jgi:excisionase family DNA binding protein
VLHEMMTPEQVAEYLQLNTDTVYRLIRQNQLVASQIGRTYRIPKADLEKFLLVHSNRHRVREEMFDRMMSIGENNPGLDSDEVLEYLEQYDLERKAKQAPAQTG